VPRWLLSLLAVLTLLGSSVTARAAAGFSGDPKCCCPDKAKCHCHDHDGQPDHTAKLKRCGGEATFAAMDIASAVTPEVRVVFDVTVTQIEIVQAIRIPDDWSSEPEKPPI
jgi:hypothetical protein